MTSGWRPRCRPGHPENRLDTDFALMDNENVKDRSLQGSNRKSELAELNAILNVLCLAADPDTHGWVARQGTLRYQVERACRIVSGVMTRDEELSRLHEQGAGNYRYLWYVASTRTYYLSWTSDREGHTFSTGSAELVGLPKIAEKKQPTRIRNTKDGWVVDETRHPSVRDPSEAPAKSPEGCICQDCNRPYSVDFNVPDSLWKRIRPDKSKPRHAGLLCGQCITRRIEALGGAAFHIISA